MIHRGNARARRRRLCWIGALLLFTLGLPRRKSFVQRTLECGYPGISALECKLLGCTRHTDLTCTHEYPSLHRGFTCAVDPSERSDCGYPSISEQACLQSQCCFRDSGCFFPRSHKQIGIFQGRNDEKTPFFSVIVTCYGLDANLLPNALRSVTSQSYQKWEAIVVDDGSANRSCVEVANLFVEQLTSIQAAKFRILYKNNGFVADARNYGISRAQGVYILPVDADDYLSPNFLMEAARALQRDGNLELIYADQFFFGMETLQPRWHLWEHMRLKSALRRGPLPVTTVYTKNLWRGVGGYKLDMIFGNEDYNYWIDVLSTFPKSKKVPGISSWYRLKADAMHTETDYKMLAMPMLRTHQANLFSKDIIEADLAKIFCYLRHSKHVVRLREAISKQPDSCPAWLWYALHQLSNRDVLGAEHTIDVGLLQCEDTLRSFVIRQYMETVVYRISLKDHILKRVLRVKCAGFGSDCSSCERTFKRIFYEEYVSS